MYSVNNNLNALSLEHNKIYVTDKVGDFVEVLNVLH